MDNNQEPQNAEEIRVHIESTKRRLRELEGKLRNIEENCNNGRHHWGDVKDESYYVAGYTIPGDPPGTCGSDWRGPTYVPSYTQPKYTRTCKVCGKVQTTNREEEVKHITKVPRF
jgi:hypothetical protein